MYVVQLTYKAPLSEIDKFVQAHRDFLDLYYKQGLFLVSGPMRPRTGGILVALTTDKSYLESVLQKDPYYLADVATYQLIEFTPLAYRSEIKDIVQKSEEKSC